MFSPSLLWARPEVNPINHKARSIPIFNLVSVHGRVFFFSWFGFLIAFWSWYAFPPLLKNVIAKDMDLSQAQISTSNIIALLATLLVRLVAGPACDRFGPRWTFAGCLLIGAIPTFLSGAAFNFHQLCALRFFIGILGGSFVPCQVWTTGFYDKNIVGTANSLTAGFGNAGGGITYFAMPAIFNSLVANGLTEHVAWRVAFVVPGILIVTVAVLMLLLCPDTPTGKWSEREEAAASNARQQSTTSGIVDVRGTITEDRKDSDDIPSTQSPTGSTEKTKKSGSTSGNDSDNEAQVGEQRLLDDARGEIIQKPSFKEVMRVMFSPQTIVLGACYFCSFGAELSINSILGSYFGQQFPNLGLQGSGNWAAMFGLMNAVFRPLGGLVSDLAYQRTNSVWSKKILLHVYLFITGAFLVAAGLTNPTELGMMVGLINIGAAFFLEGANGLNYALVPHVHPYANGVVSGFTGACGNFGGIMFAIIFRYEGHNYGKSIWIIGVLIVGLNLATFWIKPLPKGQVGGK